MDKLEEYLDRVCRGLGGPRPLRQHLRQELREHLRDAVDQYVAFGLPTPVIPLKTRVVPNSNYPPTPHTAKLPATNSAPNDRSTQNPQPN